MATGRGAARRRSRRPRPRCGVRHRVVLLGRRRRRRAHRPAAPDGHPRPRRPRTVAGHRGRASARPVGPGLGGRVRADRRHRRAGRRGHRPGLQARPRGARARDAGPRRCLQLRRGPADRVGARLPERVGAGRARCLPGVVRARCRDDRYLVHPRHGHDGSRGKSLRYLPALHALGMPVLVPTTATTSVPPPRPTASIISGQPSGRTSRPPSTGRSTTAPATWCWGAGRWAVRSRSRSPTGSDVAGKVRGLVLDSPVVDWRDVLQHQGADRNLPSAETALATWVAERRFGLDFDRLDWVSRARGAARADVARARRRRLLRARRAGEAARHGPPDLVTLHLVPNAGHTLVDIDPAGYERVLTAWLRSYAALPTPLD